MKNFIDTIWNRTSDLPICCTAFTMFCYVQATNSWKRSFLGERFVTQAVIDLASQFIIRAIKSRSLFLDKFTLNRKADCFVETLVAFYNSTWRIIAEDLKHQKQRRTSDSASFIEQKVSLSYSTAFNTGNYVGKRKVGHYVICSLQEVMYNNLQ